MTVIAPVVKNVAVIVPKKIAGNAYASLISKSAAIIEPVRAPVPGRGIATKMKSPNAEYF